MKQVPELLTLSEKDKENLLRAAEAAMEKGQRVWGPSCCKEVNIRRPGQGSKPEGDRKGGGPDGCDCNAPEKGPVMGRHACSQYCQTRRGDERIGAAKAGRKAEMDASMGMKADLDV